MVLVTPKVNETYQYYIGQLAEDMGFTIVIKIQTGRNSAIPANEWDDENNEPLSSADWPDDSVWYGYTEYTIEHVILIYPEDYSVPLPAGIFDSQDVKIMCKLEDVLVNPAEPTGATYFDLDGFEYATIEGYNYVRKGTPRKSGLLGDDRFMCEIILTRRLE